MNKIEIYIGYTDKTWDTAFINMPKNIPNEEIESFVIQGAIDLWANTSSVHEEVAFAGIYNECPIEEEEEKDKSLFFEGLIKHHDTNEKNRRCFRYVIEATNMTEATEKLEAFTPIYYTLRIKPIKQIGTKYIYNDGKPVKHITRILLEK